MSLKRIEKCFPNTPIPPRQTKSNAFHVDLSLRVRALLGIVCFSHIRRTLTVLRNRARCRPTEPMLALLAGTFFTILGARTIRIII